MNRGFEILLEALGLLVVNKPHGLLTQAPPGIDSLEVRIKRLLTDRDPARRDYLGVPHRLDRASSGVMVWATDRKSARLLAQQFEARTVKKTYWALLEGNVVEDQGTWIDWLRKVPDQPRGEVVDAAAPGAQEAVLDFVVRERTEGMTWLEVELKTGRMHQVRLQAAARQHPVLGDALYGGTTQFGPHCSDPREQPIALHAATLEFEIPRLKKRIAISALPPPLWREVLPSLPTETEPPH